MRDNFNDLYYLIVVVRERSFTRAAAKPENGLSTVSVRVSMTLQRIYWH
ncbi:hypothetical protein [Citrobacter pasteurii]|nr:transcriptional regulator, LysR family [Shigella flexneri 1235-66]CEJ67235.1 hypothetical protein [Citrobacter pasteurii]